MQPGEFEILGRILMHLAILGPIDHKRVAETPELPCANPTGFAIEGRKDPAKRNSANDLLEFGRAACSRFTVTKARFHQRRGTAPDLPNRATERLDDRARRAFTTTPAATDMGVPPDLHTPGGLCPWWSAPPCRPASPDIRA